MKDLCSRGWPSKLFEPDVLLPSQFFNRYNRDRHHLSSEKRLMLAVLESAVAVFRKHASSQDLKGRELFQEAKDWITCDDAHWSFSFCNICDALELDPSYLRRGLMGWEAKDRKKIAPQVAREELV